MLLTSSLIVLGHAATSQESDIGLSSTANHVSVLVGEVSYEADVLSVHSWKWLLHQGDDYHATISPIRNGQHLTIQEDMIDKSWMRPKTDGL